MDVLQTAKKAGLSVVRAEVSLTGIYLNPGQKKFLALLRAFHMKNPAEQWRFALTIIHGDESVAKRVLYLKKKCNQGLPVCESITEDFLQEHGLTPVDFATHLLPLEKMGHLTKRATRLRLQDSFIECDVYDISEQGLRVIANINQNKQ